MAEDSPTHRISQIFDSLAHLSDFRSDSGGHSNHNVAGGPVHIHAAHHYAVGGVTFHAAGGNDGSAATTPSPTASLSSASTQSGRHSSGSSTGGGGGGGAGVGSGGGSGVTVIGIQPTVANSTARIVMGPRSTPNSPRLMPRRANRPPAVPQRPNAALIANPGLVALDADAPWPHFSSLTDHLDVHQVNNYHQTIPEINWQERCLELQLELHRSKNQAGRIRDMLREKLSELEQRVIDAEGRAEEAEDKVRAMEQRLSEWPKSQHPIPPPPLSSASQSPLPPSSAQTHHCPAHQTTSSVTSSTITNIPVTATTGNPLVATDTEKTITHLETQVEEQRQLRLHDARQVEAKAARIKEWVTNKLRDLEEQNQVLREQNLKCNQQLELLRNHISGSSRTGSPSRSPAAPPPSSATRNSLSFDVPDYELRRSRRRSESLDPPEQRHSQLHNHIHQTHAAHHPHGALSHLPPHHPAAFGSPIHHRHRRNLSMEPHELARDLAAAVDGLNLIPLTPPVQRAALKVDIAAATAAAAAEVMPHTVTGVAANVSSVTVDPAHDYAEIYTPSRERAPIAWLKASANSSTNPSAAPVFASGSTSGGVAAVHASHASHVAHAALSDSAAELATTRPPTPPLHRFPSWEAKIYQVANDGLAAGDEATDGGSEPGDGMVTNVGAIARGQQTASGGYCDINVPVYATVKGRASQIRSIPFTGDSSDDSSDGEEHAVMLTTTCTTTSTHNSHNSSSTDNTESSTSGSASSPSKSMKTSSSLSPAKRSGSESPKPTNKMRDTSFESGMSDDYAIPPDAFSSSESTTCMDASMPSLLMRSSYVDSPNKKMESLEKIGHLAKLSGKLKTWRKRWFVLKNGSLAYWKCQNDVTRKPQGQIVLDEACRISRADGASTFEIDTGKKTYYLTADSNATMDDWIRVLQNVQRRNATKLLLSRDDQKPTFQGWVTKVKNGHAKKCWCVLLGKMFLYFKAPGETNPFGQINMRDARVEEVEHVSDSDSEEREDPAQSQAKLTVAIYPAHQGPTYLILPGKQERDNWLYHLTVVSGGGKNAGTQYEQLIQKLMETDGDPNCVLWRHPILLHTKENITSPLTSLHSELHQTEAIKLFKCCQLFMSVAVNQPGIDYHVVLAQNALQQALDMVELQAELVCAFVKQTSRHTGQKLGVGVQVNKRLGKQTRQLLLCATQSLFTCDAQQGGGAAQANGCSPSSIQAPLVPPIDCKSNPPTFTFVQGWQLLALAVSLFVPKNNRLLWYLKLHLSRNADSKSECGKYAAYCERALERTLQNGGRETKPSRMEVLSILLKNPYHHSLPHAIPVHMMNGAYQVVSFDGSSTIEEFHATLAQEIACRDTSNGFTLFSDDPIEKDLEHYLDPQAKLCDVISKWETALREKGSGKFENSRVIQLTYKNRLYWKHSTKYETDRERLLLCYQINQQVVQGRFPLSRDLALELASLMAQIDMGDWPATEKTRASMSATIGTATTGSSGSGGTGAGGGGTGVAANGAGIGALQALDKFYPYRYCDALTPEAIKEMHELLAAKWALLRGRSSVDCVRIYLTCCRKWPFFGAALFQAKPRHSDQAMAWLAVAEDALTVLELSSMVPIARYPYGSVMTFGGCQDDFMLVVLGADEPTTVEQKLLFAMSKPKILEITLLIADYMNALGHTLPGTPQMNTLTRNGSHRSIRSRPLPTSTAATTAHNTLNSHATHSLHSHITLAGGSGTFGHGSSTLSSSHGGQPDILKSTPDHHQRIK